MLIAPEVLAEQVMWYVIWASELIPTLPPHAGKIYSVAILPQGPHFYTGLLEAAGYLLLDNQKKKIIIISQQTDNPKNIIVDTRIYGATLGKKRNNPANITATFSRKIGARISKKQESLEKIDTQLSFIRTITDTEAFLHIGIGEKTPQIQITKLLTWIKNNIQDYNIVLLTNIELPISSKDSKINEHTQISKSMKTSSSPASLLSLFQNILSLQKKKPEIIAYVNPGDIRKNWGINTRYVCAVW